MDVVYPVLGRVSRDLRANLGDVDRLQAFCPLLYIKLHSLALLQALISLPSNGLEMNKNVLAAFTRDETVALRVVEPFHGSLFHAGTPFRKDEQALETSCREIVRNRNEKRKGSDYPSSQIPNVPGRGSSSSEGRSSTTSLMSNATAAGSKGNRSSAEKMDRKS